MELNPLSNVVIGCAIRVHRALGPGLLESAYRECLAYEFSQTGLDYLKEEPVPLIYGTARLKCAYKFDFLVEDKLIVELKAVEALHKVHKAQVNTYLRLLGLQLGLLINFNRVLLKDGGIERVVNNFQESGAYEQKIFHAKIAKGQRTQS